MKTICSFFLFQRTQFKIISRMENVIKNRKLKIPFKINIFKFLSNKIFNRIKMAENVI